MILKCDKCHTEHYEELEACPICGGALRKARFYTVVRDRVIETTDWKEKNPGKHINLAFVK